MPKGPFNDFLHPHCLLLVHAKSPEVSLLSRLSRVAACSLQSSPASCAHGWHFVLHAAREREKRFTLATSHKEAYAVHGLSMLTLVIHRIRASSDWMHF